MIDIPATPAPKPLPAPDPQTAFRHGLVVGGVGGSGSSVLAFLLYLMLCTPPTVTVPAEVQAEADTPVQFMVSSIGTVTVAPSKGVKVFGLPGNVFYAWAAKDGTYALTAKAHTLLGGWGPEAKICLKVGTTPDPGPGPGPGPGPQPSPAPIPAPGLHVLIVEDNKARAALTPDQYAALFGGVVHAYLDAKCAADPDGKQKAYRIWDKGVTSPAPEEKLFVDAMARPRTTLPWIIVSNPDRGGGWEGPLPKTNTEIMTLLQKYGG